MVMPILITFRITVLSVPCFNGDFVEKNAANLEKKITRTLAFVDHDYIFSSFIELLPGSVVSTPSHVVLFSVPQPYPPATQSLFHHVRETLLSIYKTDIRKITAQTCQQPTRTWRCLYLLSEIVTRTPSVLPLFLSDLILCCEQVYGLYKSIAAVPNLQWVLYSQDLNALPFSLLSLLTCSMSDTVKIGLPPVPVLKQAEVVYDLLLLVKLCVAHLPRLGEHHSAFMKLLFDFFVSVQRAEMLSSVLDWLTPWLEGEEEVFTAQDIHGLLFATREDRNLQESVLYVSLIASYWRFVHALCRRYLRGSASSTAEAILQDRSIQEGLELSVISGMTVTNPEIRALFRPLFFRTLPSSLFLRIEALLNDVVSVLLLDS